MSGRYLSGLQGPLDWVLGENRRRDVEMDEPMTIYCPPVWAVLVGSVGKRSDKRHEWVRRHKKGHIDA